MAKLEFNYANRKSSASSDTPKIFISMHPIDRCTYLEPLIENILSSHDLTICYSSSPSDTSLTELNKETLLIIGVTEKYLVWNNSGFTSEALPAIKKGVPVLPIMLEDGIVNLFNTRCGKLHYIENPEKEFSNKTIFKINNHITAVFNSDNLPTHNVKSKIFISYRKSDANELSRLVKLIKSHSKSDDIFLWYDTSLNPGENYSHTIIKQIKSCDLFLMLITPNILEPNNYVMRVEYPLAIKEKKRIIPIVMQKTDLKKLSKAFPDIPKCITDTQVNGIFSKIKK